MGVGGLDGGGPVDMLATWCVRKLRGDAALCAVPRVVGGGVEL